MRFIRPAFLCAALLACAVSVAQTPPPPPPPGAGGGETGGGPRFDQAKQKHIEHLQQELSCVQAATTFEAMRACRPQRPPKG